MKICLLIASVFLLPINAFGQDSAKEQPKVAKKSPFYKMYPKSLAPAAEKYFGEWNKALFKNGPINAKAARLAAISAFAVIKCEYCIIVQVVLVKAAGASDDEIKAAIQIAAEVSRFSILLYGNEFGQDNLKKILKKMTQKPAQKPAQK
jgi:AhpD family alkylhydroperoxidase